MIASKHPRRCGGLAIRIWIALLLASLGTWEVQVPRTLGQSASENSKGVLPVKRLQRKTPVDFEQEILPVLKSNCLACHNKTTSKGELILETPATILKGGETGPAVVPGKPAESLLLKVATHESSPRMPPRENKVSAVDLNPEQLGLLQLWIQQGAKGEVRGEVPLTWQPLPSSLKAIYAVALSPEGLLAACARGNRISVYDLTGRNPVFRMGDKTFSTARLPQSKVVAVAAERPALRSPMISFATPLSTRKRAKTEVAAEEQASDPILPAELHRDWVNALCFSPDGERLASAGYREVKIWNRRPPVLIQEIPEITEDARLAAVSSKGRFAAIGGAAGSVQIIDLATGRLIWKKNLQKASLTALHFSLEEDRLLIVLRDGSASVWDAERGKRLGSFQSAGEIVSARFLGGSEKCVLGRESGVVQIWEQTKKTGWKFNQEFVAHTNAVSVIEPQMDGSRFLTGSADGSLALWDAAKGKLLQRWQHAAPLSSAAISADGKRFASAGQDGSVKVWLLEKQEPMLDGRGDLGLLRAQAAVDRTTKLAAQAVLYSKNEWQSSTNELNGQLERHKKAIESIATAEKASKEKRESMEKANEASNAANAALGAFDKEFKSISDSLESLQKQAAALVDGAQFAGEYKAYSEKTRALITEKRKIVAQKSADATKAAEAAAAEHKKTAMALANAENERDLAVQAVEKTKLASAAAEAALRGAESHAVKASEEAGKAETARKNGARPIRSVSFEASGDGLASVDEAGVAHWWAPGQGTPVSAIAPPLGGARGMAVIEHGAKWLVLGEDRSLRLWQRGMGWDLEKVLGGSGTNNAFAHRVTALAFSPEGASLATGGGHPSRSGEVKIWDVARGTLRRDLTNVHSDVVFGVDFSPDGGLLATCSADRFAKVTDIGTGQALKTLEGHTDYVLSVRWRADGRGLATGGADGVVKVWDLKSGERKRNVDGAAKEVTAVRYVGLADHTLIASGDSQLRVNNEKGEKIRSFEIGKDYIQGAEITMNGDRVVAGGESGVLHVFDSNGKTVASFGPEQQ